MAEESNVAPVNQALTQGLVDLRQTWEHLARELAGGVPELPAVIDQELASLNLDDLNEETLIRVTEAVVARVAAAGFPDEAAVLLRRMGRALYELLLLLATQEEIRDMKPPAFAPEVPAPQLTVLRPPDGDGLDPFDLLEVELEPEQVALPKPQPSPNGNLTSTEHESNLPRSVSPAIAMPRDPRDPIRPAASRIAATRAPAPAPESPPVLEVAAVMAPARTPPAPSITIPPPPEVPIEAPSTPSPAPALPPPPEPTMTPPPPPAGRPTTTIPPDVVAPPPPEPALVPPPPPAGRPTTTIPPAVVVPPPPVQSRRPEPRELTEEESPLWGFDPATRQPETSDLALDEPPAPEIAEEPAPDRAVAMAAVAPEREEMVAPPEPATAEPSVPVEQAPRSSWTVRLSPRRATEQERKLAAREVEMTPLVEEIVAAARSLQDALSSRGNARRVMAAAKERPPLAATADPGSDVKTMLEAGQLEEAATMALQMASSSPDDDSAAVVCAVGEAVRQAKRLELAVLCFTTAVLTAPPCDRACWQLCTLSVERRDAEAAPIWLEFVARLLRVQGADLDAISVYRQLLKLSPRRTDIRELLRVSSLTGQLPN